MPWQKQFGLYFLGFTFAVSIAAWCWLAGALSLDYWDGYNFLLQARRLHDVRFDWITVDPFRPRGLIVYLYFVDKIGLLLNGYLPSLKQYHLSMVFVTIVYVGVSWGVIRKIFGEAAALLGTLFLLLNPVLHHYSVTLLADLWAGVWMGLAVLFWEQRRRNSSIVCATFCGLCKYHFLLFVPALLLIGRWREKIPRMEILRLMAICGITLEAVFLLWGGWDAGLWFHIEKLFIQTVHMAQVLRRPPTLYLDGLYRMYGLPFWLLFAGALFKSVESKLVLKSSVLAVIAMALITQALPQREIRYLFPMLPLLLGYVAYRMSALGKWRWVAISLCLIVPFIKSVNEFKVYASDPVYQIKESDFLRMGEQIRAYPECERVNVCPIRLRAQTWEQPQDEFYRSYDLGPQYLFYGQRPYQFIDCKKKSPIPPGDCVIAPDRNRGLRVIKPGRLP